MKGAPHDPLLDIHGVLVCYEAFETEMMGEPYVYIRDFRQDPRHCKRTSRGRACLR